MFISVLHGLISRLRKPFIAIVLIFGLIAGSFACVTYYIASSHEKQLGSTYLNQKNQLNLIQGRLGNESANTPASGACKVGQAD